MSLRFSPDDTLSSVATAKRLASINEAASWPRGRDADNKISTIIFKSAEYEVRLSKPGKEAGPEYDRAHYQDGHYGNNPNDMRPEITYKNALIEKNATFTDIFVELQKIHLQSIEGIRILACLLARSAYMADHVEITPGIWRYQPPKDAIERLTSLIPDAYEVPIEIFLHYLEALALNEDTKYHTLGYDIKKGIGRKNNLLTCVHVIAVLLGEASLAKFAGQFARGSGISALPLIRLVEMFPELTVPPAKS